MLDAGESERNARSLAERPVAEHPVGHGVPWVGVAFALVEVFRDLYRFGAALAIDGRRAGKWLTVLRLGEVKLDAVEVGLTDEHRIPAVNTNYGCDSSALRGKGVNLFQERIETVGVGDDDERKQFLVCRLGEHGCLEGVVQFARFDVHACRHQIDG